MSRFWPEGLSVNDVQSPDEILENAREEWETSSNAVLTLVLQKSESEDGNAIVIIHAKHAPSNRTATLFSIIHRLNESYPVTIQPRLEDNLPNILKKSYSQRGVGDEVMMPIAMLRKGKTVTNKWVSDTPSEFREKLAEVFNLSVVKATVFNLVSGSQTVSGDNDIKE
jgi:hypothetical protein